MSHLVYAPGLAEAMPQRQQAAAIIATRNLIVGGALNLVHMALEQPDHASKIQLDEERKAAMVSHPRIPLCGETEHAAQRTWRRRQRAVMPNHPLPA